VVNALVSEAMLHLDVDVGQRDAPIWAPVRAELHVRPVFEAGPVPARSDAKADGFLGVDVVAVEAVDLLIRRPLGPTVDDPEAIDGLAPLMPRQTGDGIGNRIAVLRANLLDAIGQKRCAPGPKRRDLRGDLLARARLAPELGLLGRGPHRDGGAHLDAAD